MLALACDHGGLALKKEIAKYLSEKGIAYKDFGTHTEDSCDYPLYGAAAARARLMQAVTYEEMAEILREMGARYA